MESRPSKPTFASVVDLGLRDVGVENEPRRLGAHFGKASLKLFALVVLSFFAMCVIVGGAGAGAWLFVPFVLAWTVGLLLLSLRMAKRSPVVVVKVTAEGANQATWVLIAPSLFLSVAALLTRSPLMIPMVVLAAIMALVAWRARGRVPKLLRGFRPLLAADEPVLGDGVGAARGARRWHDAFRLVVATDRRVLVAGSTRSTELRLLVDVPYPRVSRFGFEWTYLGRLGVLSLTVAGVDDEPSETHVIASMAPANLLSIAQALRSHGVPADDPAALVEAERAWEEAQRRDGSRRPGEPRRRLLDRAAMDTREFDRGLWLLLGLAAVAFYLNPFGVGLGVSRNWDAAILLVVPALCGICGYVSRTKSSLAYVVPLNLLVSPAFFFVDASYVIAVMIILSALATLALWAGSALRRARDARAGAAATAAASPGPRAPRGSLRYTLSGLGLIRLSGMMLGALVALVVTASAAGVELTSVRLALDEATLRQVPVDGRSNLTGNTASFTYTPGPDLREFITDHPSDADPTDGLRWELRSSWTKGYNVVSLAHYVPDPRLDDAASVAEFVADKDREHARLAGSRVTHTERVVDGRKGYVWNHGSERGYWYYAAWFPRPPGSVRVECIARRQERRFRRLCAETMRSLRFR